MTRTLVSMLAGLILTAASGAFAQRPEPAAVRPVTDTHYGETLTDPYRWMESMGPEFMAWIKTQDAATRAFFAAMPGYNAFRTDERAAYRSEVALSSFQRVGDQLYFQRQAASAAQPSLWVRSVADGRERMLVDPVALAGPTAVITYYAPSPDNHYLVYAMATGGSEESSLHFVDLHTGRALPEVIDRARQAVPSWSGDGDVVFYTRMKATFSDPADRFRDLSVLTHRPGDPIERDQVVATGLGLGSSFGRAAWVTVQGQPGSDYLLAQANSGVSQASEWYVVKRADLDRDGPSAWRRLAAVDDAVDGTPVIRGNSAYLSTFRTTPRRQIVRVNLDALDLARASVIVPEQTQVLRNLVGAADGLYVVHGDPSGFRLDRVDYATESATPITLPYAGAIVELTADPRQAGVMVGLQSYVRPTAVIEVANGRARDLRLAPPFALDLAPLTVETIYATARDGAHIPVSVLHRRDLKRDGTAPAMAEAYGAYGSADDPTFMPGFMPFLLRGGVLATVHVRGGGDYGEAWHLAGKEASKPNTWRDFIAGVKALEAAGFTSHDKLTGIGISAGGIMIGRTVTEDPGLLNAAVMWAPMTNMLRFELTEGGPANTAEFGSTETASGYAALRAMDSYSHVTDRTAYPATLITIGVNDHRVPPWMGAEMAARLSAASSSGKPVMLRVDFAGGHHAMGVAKDDMADQFADTFAFALHAAGDPMFKSATSK
jgi:prolyl oligopeptidase